MCYKCSSFNGIEKCPKLRFPEFTEPWVCVRIGDVYAERSERGAESAELLSVTMTEGVKRRSDIEGKDNSSEDKGNYKVVSVGDMVYNSMRMWQGANGISAYDGIVSPAYTVLTPRVEIANGFFGALFKTHRSISEFYRHSQGMTSDTWNLKYPQIETIRIHIPSFNEQKKISEFLSVIESKIEKQRDFIELLKKYKRGLLQAIFSREVQFENSSSWERRLFSQIASLSKGKYSPKQSEALPCIELEHLEQQTGQIIGYANSNEQNSVKSVFHKGDVLFGKLRPYLRKYALPEYDGVCSSEIWVFHPEQDIDSTFLFYLIQSESFIAAANISSGTKMPRAEWSKVSNESFFVPGLSEQKRIATLFNAIDKRIVNASVSVNKLQRLKQGLLQQLFI